jgi:hypothetical protein
MEEEKKCYIRYEGQSWTRGKSYHAAALQAFLKEEIENVRILIPRGEWAPFIAYFRRVNENFCIYRTEKNQEVEIMMERPSRVGFINRIMSY